MTEWLRHRFHANVDDPRPVVFPPPGPWWCSGYADYGDEPHSIVVAYLPQDVDLLIYWPEAQNISTESRQHIVYTERFPRPEWWEGA